MANSMIIMKYNSESLKISPYFQQKDHCAQFHQTAVAVFIWNTGDSIPPFAHLIGQSSDKKCGQVETSLYETLQSNLSVFNFANLFVTF